MLMLFPSTHFPPNTTPHRIFRVLSIACSHYVSVPSFVYASCKKVKVPVEVSFSSTRNFGFFYVFSTVHHSIELFHQPILMHNSLFINNMYVTLLSSTRFEH